MTSRSMALAAAAALVAIIGFGVAFVGALLLAVAVGEVGYFDRMPGMALTVGLLGVAGLVAAALTFAAAAGLWLRRSWGWAGSLAIALLALVGAVIAIDTGGAQLPVQAGMILAVLTVGLLLVPSTRTATGIG